MQKCAANGVLRKHHFRLLEIIMKSSARNQIPGTVSRISRFDHHCLVTLATTHGSRISAQISQPSCQRLKLAEGSPAVAMIKAGNIMLLTDLAPMAVSAENCLPGTIARIEQGAVNNVVTLDIGGGLSLCAGITLYSSENLLLQTGTPALAVFNATDVVLAVLV